MAITFPASPVNGQTHTENGQIFVFDSTRGYWLLKKQDQIVASTSRSTFVATAGQTVHNVSYDPSAAVIVSVNGVMLNPQDVTATNGTSITFDTALTLSDEVDIVFHQPTASNLIRQDISDPMATESYVQTYVTNNSSAGATTSYANTAAFPSSGNSEGDLAFAQDTNTLYVWDGSEWDRIYSGAQESIEWTTEPPDEHVLNLDGTTSTLTGVAVDPDSFPVTYSYDTNPANPVQASIVDNNDGSYTFTPTTDISNAGSFIFRSKANDGISTIKKSTTVSLIANYSNPSQPYNANSPDGLVNFQHDDIAGGNVFQVRYASYGGKGWFEMAFFADGDPYNGSYLNWPWLTNVDTHFLVTGSSNTGWNGSINYGSEYGLRNRNAQGSLGGVANTSSGLDYAKDVGVLLFGPAFTCDGVLITAKSSKTADGVAANSNVTQQDAEGNTIYPLNTPAHMPNTALKTAFHNYWMGLAPAVNWEDGTYSSGQNRDHWQITSGSTFKPYISMNNRGGNVNSDEWHIATGYHGPSGASTFRPNIGYRNSTSYGYSNVGSWKSQPGTSEDIPWASDHVLSIWVSGS